jgi:hypothetical protein
MQCIYLGEKDGGDIGCYIQIGATSNANIIYHPDGDTQKKYCKTENFRSCPRYCAAASLSTKGS